MTEPDIDRIVGEIREAFGTARMPPELQTACTALAARADAVVDHLSACVVAVVLSWCADARRNGVEEVVAEQVALGAAHWGLLTAAAGLKARRGEALSPGRMAIAAWTIAAKAAESGVGPADLDRTDELMDELRTPVERERDELREIIDEIADMDLGDVEMEHREIIALCRSTQKRWTEA